MSGTSALTVLKKVEVEGMSSDGRAVARYGGVVVFIPFAAPGDIIDVKVTAKRKNFVEGTIAGFHHYSEERTDPVCPYFGTCGGCSWQYLKYSKQLEHKQALIGDIMKRIGKIDLEEVDTILESPGSYYYRNKLEYTFSSSRWLTGDEISSGLPADRTHALGFHKPGFFDRVIDIHECHLQPEPTNVIRNAVRDYALKMNLPFYNIKIHTGYLRNLIIRNTADGQVMVIVVFSYEDRKLSAGLLDFIKKEFPSVTSLYYIINGKKNDSVTDLTPVLWHGSEYLVSEMNGFRFRVGPNSFYQTNSMQAARLYDKIKTLASLTGNEIVYDLYTGTGTIACYVASEAKKVIGLEYVDLAVEDAKANAAANGIDNVDFYTGDIKQLLGEGLFGKEGRPDVIITDPPRSGMHLDVVNEILEAGPSRIIYVSCNASTQARDIALLSEKYEVKYTGPVDMFPQTPHIENVVLLVRRDNFR